MPEICRFYGIIIKMYFLESEHNPPHIHVSYGESSCVVDIEKNVIINGRIPKKALSMVEEWVELHKKELLDMWKSDSTYRLPPLE